MFWRVLFWGKKALSNLGVAVEDVLGFGDGVAWVRKGAAESAGGDVAAICDVGFVSGAGTFSANGGVLPEDGVAMRTELVLKPRRMVRREMPSPK
jgi:hypothetical protein